MNYSSITPFNNTSTIINSLSTKLENQQIDSNFSYLLDKEINKKTNLEDDNFNNNFIINDSRNPTDIIDSLKSNSSSEMNTTTKNKQTIIDKNSKLYEQALELESFFVKIMVSSMRATIVKTNLANDNEFASKLYQDMLYDEFSMSLTKNAEFGLADQIYLQLS